jgi:hypothetical protein
MRPAGWAGCGSSLLQTGPSGPWIVLLNASGILIASPKCCTYKAVYGVKYACKNCAMLDQLVKIHASPSVDNKHILMTIISIFIAFFQNRPNINNKL